MKSIIKNLTPEQKDALAALTDECSSYKEACTHARDKLGIQLSPATLCRFYTTYRIADDADARADYAAAAGIDPANLMQLTENQLQLRLLELASRPNPGASDLRALFQIITRLRALVLSERRVLVAERRIALAENRDQRETQPPQPQPSASPLEIKRRVKIALGKSTDDIDAEIARQAAANRPAPDTVAQASEPAVSPISKSAASLLTRSHPQTQQDQDKLIVLWTKHLLGKEITIGDELRDEHSPVLSNIECK
jgi:hypothetical protein